MLTETAVSNYAAALLPFSVSSEPDQYGTRPLTLLLERGSVRRTEEHPSVHERRGMQDLVHALSLDSSPQESSR